MASKHQSPVKPNVVEILAQHRSLDLPDMRTSKSSWILALVAGLLAFQSAVLSQFGDGPQREPRATAIAPAHVAASGDTMMASAILSNGQQQMVVLDQAKRTMATYHIDSHSGDIQLKSVRKIDADLMLQEFNLSEPTPTTIRKNVR
jgi:hypothetical protein